MREKEKDNIIFNFLHEDDPYYKFYEWRLSEHQAGRGVSSETGIKPTNGVNAIEVQKGPKKPEEFEFSADLPPISAQDLDIVKLTALYVARNGNKFLSSLAHRESKNFQFDFLRPTHSFYPLFSSLIDQYRKVFKPSSILSRKIHEASQNKYGLLESAKIRAEFQAHQEEANKKAAEEADAERIAYSEIDWHDFVVVETIEFSKADKESTLPPPVSLAELQYASLEQKRMGTLRIEEAAPDYQPEPEPVIPTYERSSSPEPEEQRESQPEQEQEQEEGAEPIVGLDQPSVPASMKIRAAGTSRRDRLKQKERMVRSHLTGEMIPESKYDEHVRITLLDPKWKEQRAKEDRRQATTNLSALDVEANLKRLASAMESVADDKLQTDEERTKRVKTDVQWDGHAATREQAIRQAAANVSIKDQIKQKKEQYERENAIGPKRS